MVAASLHCYISAMLETLKSLVQSSGCGLNLIKHVLKVLGPCQRVACIPSSPSTNTTLFSRLERFEGTHIPFLKSLDFWKQSRKPCSKAMEVLEIMEKVKIENARRKCKKYFALNSKIYVKEFLGEKKVLLKLKSLWKLWRAWDWNAALKHG